MCCQTEASQKLQSDRALSFDRMIGLPWDALVELVHLVYNFAESLPPEMEDQVEDFRLGMDAWLATLQLDHDVVIGVADQAWGEKGTG